MESTGHGCLETADASGAQVSKLFGEKEKAARLAFSTRFWHNMWPKQRPFTRLINTILDTSIQFD